MGEIFFNRRAGRELWALILAAVRPERSCSRRAAWRAPRSCARRPRVAPPGRGLQRRRPDISSPSTPGQSSARAAILLPILYYRYWRERGRRPATRGGVGGTPQAGRAAECIRPADQLTFEHSRRVDPRRKRRRRQFLRRRRLANSGTVKTLTNRGTPAEGSAAQATPALLGGGRRWNRKFRHDCGPDQQRDDPGRRGRQRLYSRFRWRGLSNSGTVAIHANSGTISRNGAGNAAGGAGVFNSGMITIVTNGRTIDGGNGAAGVSNSGTIPTLANTARSMCRMAAEWRSALPWSAACGRKPEAFFSAAHPKMLQ